MWFLCGPNNYSSDSMLFVHNNFKIFCTFYSIFLNKSFETDISK